MIFVIVVIFYLEGRHAYFPDDFTRVGAELNIVWSDQCIGQIVAMKVLGQQLMSKIQIVLIDEAAIKTLTLLIEGAVSVVRKDLILQVGFHRNYDIRLVFNTNKIIGIILTRR
jgi:hypothetical protein